MRRRSGRICAGLAWRDVAALEARSSPRSARGCARSAAPASTCRSPIRPPAPRSRRDDTARSTPSTACTHLLRAKNGVSLGSGKCLTQAARPRESVPRCPTRGAPAVTTSARALRLRAARQVLARLRDPAAARAGFADRQQLGMLVALLDAERAARREAAARGPGSADRAACPRSWSGASRPACAVDPRRRVEQRPGVGMARVGQELLGRALLHHLAGIHHDDARCRRWRSRRGRG